MTDWQPIETAAPPFQELDEINAWNGQRVCAASLFEGRWHDMFHDYIDPQPTHFKPLPTPPKDEA